MTIMNDDDSMTLEIHNRVVAVARRRIGGCFEIINWPRLFGYNRAVTALTVTELLSVGYSRDDPPAQALLAELRFSSASASDRPDYGRWL